MVKPESEHHCTEYGVAAKLEPESVEAVHAHVGVLSLVGVVVEGIPGTDGAAVSPVYVSVAVPVAWLVAKSLIRALNVYKTPSEIEIPLL